MKKISIFVLSYVICALGFANTPVFAAVQSGTSSSSLTNMQFNGYYQNPEGAQQQATNIGATESGALLLQQAPVSGLTVVDNFTPSAVLTTSTVNNNRAGLYLIFAILAVFFLAIAIVLTVLDKKQAKTKPAKSEPKEAKAAEEIKIEVSNKKPDKEKSNKKARRKRKKHHR
jgi:preprotein translocase subunit SecG